MKFLIGAIVACFILYLSRATIPTEMISRAYEILLAPVRVLSSNLRHAALTPFSWIEYSSKGVRRIAEMEHRYATLVVDQQRLGELERENQQLEAQLAFQAQAGVKYLPSLLVLTEHASVPLGTREGISKGSAVISEGALVGVVDDAGFTYSKISLMQQLERKMRVKIDTTDIEGILTKENNELYIDFISSEHEIAISSTIVTIGELPGLPAELPIGTVTHIVSSSSDPVQKARVQLLIQPTQHMNVSVYQTEGR